MMEQNQISYFLELNPPEDEGNISIIDEKQDAFMTVVPECKIKRRIIEHPPLKKTTKKNGNMPKSILGNFAKFMSQYKELYQSPEDYESTKQTLQHWLKSRFDLGLIQLKMIFGGTSKRSIQNCRVLRQIINNDGLNMVGENTKVKNILSYLICLEKYSCRLANPELTGRIQSR